MILSVFAFLATSMAGLAHAETLCDTSSEICASEHVGNGNAQDGDVSYDGCDLACSGCHVHCHGHASVTSHGDLSIQLSVKNKAVFGQELIYISDLIYGLKRPPKA